LGLLTDDEIAGAVRIANEHLRDIEVMDAAQAAGALVVAPASAAEEMKERRDERAALWRRLIDRLSLPGAS
jgi:hypothetical protein